MIKLQYCSENSVYDRVQSLVQVLRLTQPSKVIQVSNLRLGGGEVEMMQSIACLIML